jgi:hypothetical protein
VLDETLVPIADVLASLASQASQKTNVDGGDLKRPERRRVFGVFEYDACPGRSRRRHSRKMPFADFFKGILRSPAFADDRDFPNSILAVARAHATTLIALRGRSSSGSRRPVPTATKLIRRAERLVREHRTGTAMTLSWKALLPPYSLETVRSTLASLCLPVSHRVTLSSAQLSSIAQSTPLTVKTDRVRSQTCERTQQPGEHQAAENGWLARSL